jgi:hypothetical protein
MLHRRAAVALLLGAVVVIMPSWIPGPHQLKPLSDHTAPKDMSTSLRVDHRDGTPPPHDVQRSDSPIRGPAHVTTVGGCYNATFPYVQNGGLRQTARLNFTVLALPSTNLNELYANLTRCSATSWMALNIMITAPGDGPFMTLPSGPDVVYGVFWQTWPRVPFHALFFPSGFFGHHTILSLFAKDMLPEGSVPDLHILSAGGRIARQKLVIAEFYQLLFNGTADSDALPLHQVVWSGAPVLFMPAVPLARIFWTLPLSRSVTLARRRLEERYGEPRIVNNSVLVEKRAFQNRAEFRQFRGYRPAVWRTIRRMAWHHNLSLHVVDLKPLTFRQQWNVLRGTSRIIVSEGSFSVWLPFLRKDTACVMIYDHYSADGWLIPRVHLPIALLVPPQQRTVKMIFLSIVNEAVPSEDVLRAILLDDVTPQVTVVTVPYNATFEAHLSTPNGQTEFAELT